VGWNSSTLFFFFHEKLTKYKSFMSVEPHFSLLFAFARQQQPKQQQTTTASSA